MRKIILLLLTSIVTLPVFADKIDAFAGFYKGQLTLADGNELKKGYPLNMYSEIFAEVYRGPNSKYRIKILTGILARAEASALADNLKADGDKIEFETVAPLELKGTITAKEVVATGKYAGQDVKLALKRFDVVSPTLGEKAPKGAVVLFDGTDPSKNWELIHDRKTPVNWILEDGAMTVKTDAKRPSGKRLNTTIESKQAFGKCKLHIEFKTAPLYDKLSQARSNSGVFFGSYEIQVLDSFGADATWDHCGSVYRQTASQYNASLQPGAWQTYDIYFTPPQFDGDKCVEFAKVTVYHNGIRVQNETPIPYATGLPKKISHTFKQPKNPLKLQLQDHTDPVSYRNIWIQELK